MRMYLNEESDCFGLLNNQIKLSEGGVPFLEGKMIHSPELAPYIDSSTLDEEVFINKSKLIRAFFIKATEIKFISYAKYRLRGVYRYGKVTVEVTDSDQSRYACVKLETNSWAGIKEMKILLQKLQAGTIAPIISYENVQKKQNAFDILRGMMADHKLSLIKRFILAWRLMLEGI
ncbi:MAG: hypothetical protein NTY12_00710 [Candidatus Falkowbacteria bacterium]|nr:hypothetical protein [Candidatus Falkowbacteria bacterium]